MIRNFRNKEEAARAFRKSVAMKETWKEAVSDNIGKEEMRKRGLETINIVD